MLDYKPDCMLSFVFCVRSWQAIRERAARVLSCRRRVMRFARVRVIIHLGRGYGCGCVVGVHPYLYAGTRRLSAASRFGAFAGAFERLVPPWGHVRRDQLLGAQGIDLDAARPISTVTVSLLCRSTASTCLSNRRRHRTHHCPGDLFHDLVSLCVCV